MKNSKISLSRLYSFAGSSTFFWFVMVVFVLQAVWLALSAMYPMAFDEDFHLGIIRLYAHHISPFWGGPPAGSDSFGAVARDPSYLYQYLMSFPYRLVTAVTNSEYAQVMVLRGLNIALFAWGITLFRKLLLKTKSSSALVNLSLLIFVLVPITPYLAAQINYDNLTFPLVALALILTLKLRHSMKAGAFDTKVLLQLYSVLLIACLVKYPFLPILLAITLYLLVAAYKFYGTPRQLWSAIRIGAKPISKLALAGLLVSALLTTGLFVERYGVNVVKYHAPVADCGQVLDYDHCKSYGPWIRDYMLEQSRGTPSLSPVAFTADWFHGMWFRSFFAISGAKTNFDNKGPLTYPAIGTIVFAAVGIVALAFSAKRLWRRYDRAALWLFSLVSVSYVAILWLDEYGMYNKTGKAVAINGRYLLLVLPLMIMLCAMAVNEVTGRRTRLKAAIAAIVLLSFVWGGGFLTYVLRSNDSWYWNNTPLEDANHFIIRDIGPYVPGFRHPTQYMP